MSPLPEANDASVRQHKIIGGLYDATPVPDSLEGFELKDADKIHEVWPEGTETAKEVSHLPSRHGKGQLTWAGAETFPIYQVPTRAIQIGLTLDRGRRGGQEKGPCARILDRSKSGQRGL